MVDDRKAARRLRRTLRAAAARAARIAGGGLALIYARSPLDGSQPASIEAVSGFATPDAARRAAEILAPAAAAALESFEVVRREPPEVLGAGGAGELLALPLRVDDRAHGALLVAGPAPLAVRAERRLGWIAEQVSLHLDHAQLRGQLAALRCPADPEGSPDQRGEEILELSEALLAQDVELLRSQKRLTRIEELKADFIEKMSRELRTPLNSIIEAIIAVLAGDDDRLSDVGKRHLRRALDEGTAFLRTLQNILDLWRIKQGEFPIETQDVSFPEVVDEAIFSVRDTLGDKPVAIEKQLAEPLPKFRTDLAKLNQVLFLLLENAAKFTSAGRIDIRARLEAGRLVCSVEDTGVGIAPDDQQFVFDEFFQVDDQASSHYRGAGLGLSLARDLLRLQDGDVSLSSEIGRGTTVTFRVPVEVS